MRAAPRAAVAAMVAALLVAGIFGAAPAEISVPPGTSVGQVAAEHPGATLVLGPGEHEPFRLADAVTVRGEPGAVVRGPIEVQADGVRLEDIAVRGGPSGVVVRRADGVELDGVSVLGAESHGIEIVEASAIIGDCRVGGLTSDYAQGIEVRNANGRPRTRITGCTIEGGREGIVSHVSRVEYHDNVVTGSALRALVITEMSEGLARGNEVRDAAGTALYCGDMSQCVFEDNRVAGVVPTGTGVRSQAGHGLVAEYYAMVHETGNAFDGLGGTVSFLSTGSILTDDPPFGIWPRGWPGALPMLPIGLAAVAGLAAVVWVVRQVLRRRPTPRSEGVLDGRLLGVIVLGFAVQTFHMVEHGVQVWQTHVADAEFRSGIVGRAVDIEWTHLTFNVAVLVFMVVTWRIARRRSAAFAGASTPAAWFGAAIVAQGYHTVEHVVRAVQHVQTGLDPAPGIAGQFLDLVWFHYAINVPVEVGSAIAVLALVREWRGAGPDQTPASAGWSPRNPAMAATSSSGHSS